MSDTLLCRELMRRHAIRWLGYAKYRSRPGATRGDKYFASIHAKKELAEAIFWRDRAAEGWA